MTAAVAGVATSASFSLTNTAVMAAGSLSGSAASSSSLVNLTAEGTSDWEHWGEGGLNRKAGVTPLLSNYAVVGSGRVSSYGNDPRLMSWSDGTPTAITTNDREGIYISGAGNGFSLTVPASVTPQTVVVYVGGWDSGGTLTTHLSDGSAPDYTATTTTASGQYDQNYTLTYAAASAGQNLTITWKMASGSGNVTLNAAALGSSITASAGTPQSATVSTVFGTALQATVTNESASPVSGADGDLHGAGQRGQRGLRRFGHGNGLNQRYWCGYGSDVHRQCRGRQLLGDRQRSGRGDLGQLQSD